MNELRRCIHGRTERQVCAKCNKEDAALAAAPGEGLPLSDRESADGPHMPRPTDICTVCGNGLVHIDSRLDAAAPGEGLDVERLARAINESGEWPLHQGIDPIGAASIAAEYARLTKANQTPQE